MRPVFSVCIVSHNRKDELEFTLNRLIEIQTHETEILVGLDACTDGSEVLIERFDNVLWSNFKNRLGASRARRALYPLAKGQIIIGFDDDSHPVDDDYTKKIGDIFSQNDKLGIIAFRIFNGKTLPARSQLGLNVGSPFFCSEFAGCGYAIRKIAYQASGGFPEWMDIYGEESCLSMRVFDAGFSLCYEPSLLVHHRVDTIKRSLSNYALFRFKKQLTNSLVLICVLYPFPYSFLYSVKLINHNFKKYGVLSVKYFITFISSVFNALKILLNTHRNPVSKQSFLDWRKLPLPFFSWKP